MKKSVLKFLDDIGIKSHEKIGAKGFMKHICIQNGELLIDPRCSISNILHEAGHLAILPSRFRKLASGDIYGVQKIMKDNIDFSDPDAPEARAFMQSGDCEATAWAWAAGKYIGIPDKQIILNKEYGNDGESIRFMLSAGRYFGVNGLAAAGFCAVNAYIGKFRNLPVYPKLKQWLQD